MMWRRVVAPLAGVGIILLGIFIQHPKPLRKGEAFQKLYWITPSQLRQRCGSPAYTVTDVLVKNDGILDLHYGRYHTNEEVIFRFTKTSNGTLDSLGAWVGVRTPDDL